MIKIDTDKCNGCGICVNACHEGALEIVDGKATIIKDDYCDGLGNCLPVCPTDAISFEMREAVDYNEEAVVENMIKLGKPVPEDLQAFIKPTASNPNTKKQSITIENMSPKQEKAPHQCPGSMMKSLNPQAAMGKNTTNTAQTPLQAPTAQMTKSQLKQWPIQIKLAPINAHFFDNAHLLIAADCCAYSYANFHNEFMRNKITLIGCPKLDNTDYSEKLTEIIVNNNLKSITIVRMEVPCCSGMEKAVTTAIKQAFQKTDKLIPWQVITLSTDGNILE